MFSAAVAVREKKRYLLLWYHAGIEHNACSISPGGLVVQRLWAEIGEEIDNVSHLSSISITIHKDIYFRLHFTLFPYKK